MQQQQRKRDVEDYNSVKTPRARGALHTEADDVLLGSSAAAGAQRQHGGRRLFSSLRRVLGRAVDLVTCTEDVPDGKDRTERWAAGLVTSNRRAAAPMHVALKMCACCMRCSFDAIVWQHWIQDAGMTGGQ
jgi:hypothetical protein